MSLSARFVGVMVALSAPQQGRDDLDELASSLYLRPVAAACEDVQVRVLQQLQHRPGDLGWDDLVFATVNQQRRCPDRSRLLLGDPQLVALMARVAEHRAIGLEGFDAGLVAD